MVLGEESSRNSLTLAIYDLSSVAVSKRWMHETNVDAREPAPSVKPTSYCCPASAHFD